MLLLLRCLTVLLVGCGASLALAAAPDTTLVLPPTPENPRNSEGDFIRLADGRLLFVYTHFTDGAGDHAQAYLASRESTDGGKTWSDESRKVVDREGDMNVMSVSLLRLRGAGDKPGPIALFYLVKNSTQDCRPVLRISTDEAQTWSEPQTVIPESQRGYYVLNNDRAIQLESGRIVLPVAEHYGPDVPKYNPAASILCYTSDDGGKTWQRGTPAPAPEPINGKPVMCQEPGVVPLADGRLLGFVRTDSGSQFVMHSQDEGTTWSQLVPSNIISPRSPATIERIPGTDHLLMVWNNHAEIDPALKGRRTPLMSAISTDNGETWQHQQTLEASPTGWYCYTALEFLGDDVLLGYCSGDRQTTNGLAQTSVTRVGLDWLRGEKKDLHLFLLVGQSNMAGRGKVAESDRQPPERVLTFSQEGEWVPAVDPIHFDKPKVAGVGLGRTFGIEIAQATPGATIGLIPCAVGGTPIEKWVPGAYDSVTKTHPWDDALARAKKALESGQLKGVLWHQGEGDSNAERAPHYEKNLTELIARFRKELDAPQVPFIIGQLGQFEARPWNDFKRQVDAAHQKVARSVPHCAFVSSDGLTDKGDGAHFSAEAYRELGKRYAKAYLEMIAP